MLIALGLVSNVVGTLLVGLVAPCHRSLTADGGSVALNWKGKLLPVGWVLVVLGVVLQVLGARVW